MRPLRSRRRLPLVAALLLVATAIATAATPRSAPAPAGSTLRVALTGAEPREAIDPALTTSFDLLGPACRTLLSFAPEPHLATLRLVPDGAAAFPKISRDGRTYTFTIRHGMRFHTGAALGAQDYVRGINRVLDPRFGGANAANFDNVVGARAVEQGSATAASGLQAHGDKLVFKLTKRVSPFVFEQNLAGVWACPVPVGTALDPEGLRAPFGGGGPYYIESFVNGQSAVLKRNRFYDGIQPHDLGRTAYTYDVPWEEIERGIDEATIDATVGIPPNRRASFAKTHGVNRRRFFVSPRLSMFYLVLNTRRPLFRDNARLRRAVNFAVDRRAVVAAFGPFAGRPAGRFLLPLLGASPKMDVYPPTADLRRARSLARGRTRAGQAVLYTRTAPPQQLAGAEVIKSDLRRIGIDVEIEAFPREVMFQKVANPEEPFDMAMIGFNCDFDPACWVAMPFDGRHIGEPDNFDFSYFNSARYNRLFDRAAPLSGRARFRAYARIEAQLLREEAPAVPLFHPNNFTFVSKRVGCVERALPGDPQPAYFCERRR